MIKHLLFLVVIALAICAKGGTYYVSKAGNDANPGTSTSAPWRTLQKVNTFNFKPGDVILFRARDTFPAPISKKNVTDLTFGSYGSGKAIIAPAAINTAGASITNSTGITIKNIIFKGLGYKLGSYTYNGIKFLVDKNARKDSYIKIDSVEVYGFGGFGVYLVSESATYGFDGATVKNSVFRDNGMGGLHVIGSWDGTNKLIRYVNTNVKVISCKAYNNRGRSDFTTNWSGSGIVIAGCIGGLIDQCEAWENGIECGSTHNGPVGIWMYDSKQTVIQNSISHHNRNGIKNFDGGGFDIDGGAQNSVIQNCKSYNNEGAGYGFFQYATGNKYAWDTVRNCTSTSDPWGFAFWGAGSSYLVTNVAIHNNKVTTPTKYVANFIGGNYNTIKIYNNEFCIPSTAKLYASTPSASKVTFSNNTFPCLVLPLTDSFTVKRIA